MLRPEKLSDLVGGGQRGSGPGWCTAREPACVSLPTAEARGYVVWLEIARGNRQALQISALFIFPPACWLPQVALVVENPPVSSGNLRDGGLIPRLGRSPEEGLADRKSVV